MTATSLWAATVEVSVSNAEGAPLPGTTIVLVEITREGVTAENGHCRFDNVPAGNYHVSARRSGFTGSRTEVSVADGTNATVTFNLEAQIHFSETVTVSPDARDTFEAYQPTAVVSGEQLQQRLGGTVGDTLDAQVGVNKRSFGPGPGRPVIRGLDGDRVLILENGLRSGDLSSQSGDHGVPLDPAAAERIEIVRGPATLLHGSNALGGVVNVLSQSIPTRPAEGVHGGLTAQGATATDEGGAAGSLSWGNGRWAGRAEGAGRRTGDVTTPDGLVPNSDGKLLSGGVGASRTADNGYVGASYAYDDTRYGIPLVEEGNIALNPRRHRFDFRGEKRKLDSFAFIEGVKFQLGHRNYKHDELEGEEVGTSFKNRFTEGQLLLNHRPVGKVKGTVGLWGTQRKFSAEGAEAFAPPTTQKTLAAFLYEEASFRHVTLQFGARVDRTSFSPESTELEDRTFTEVSGSLGLLGHLREDVTLAVSVARAARNPSLEELYNHGPHPGNVAFEIGNPDLGSEVGLGVDVSLRWRRPRFQGEVTAFRNAIADFVFPFATGEEEDDFPVVNFRAADSVLQGLELHADLGLTRDVWLEVGADAVRGELSGSGDPLPRIPPYRAWAGLRFERNGFHVEGEVRTVAKQDRVYELERPTDGYVLVNLHGSYTFAAGQTAHTVTLRLDNAGDTLYRSHLSYIKDLTPEMGRSVKLVYGVRF